jgi:lysophospholipase L1-like esterase
MRLKYLIFCSCLLAFSLAHGQSYKFDLGSGKTAAGYIRVVPETMYNAATGYGFDLNSSVISKNVSGRDPLRDDYITSAKPFFFSVKIPEGNYNVRVILGGKDGGSVTTIKAECRRLMVEKSFTQKGKFNTVDFTVHVKDSLIRSSNSTVRLKLREITYLHWDDKLTLEFNNTCPKVCAIEISPAVSIPVVFLAGNSTVVDQAEEPYAAWGQMIPVFFQPKKISIANYAESGETLKAFKGERRLQKVWSMAKAGDFLFIEFAHNDQKPGGNHLDPFTTYKQTVKEWIAEARKRGVTPVLVTSMNRRTFDSSGHITNSLGDFPEAMRQTAKEEKVPCIDLNAMSKVLYEAWGPENSIKAFVHYPANTFPNQVKELKDDTHFNVYGAYELAKCIVTGIKENVPSLAKYLKNRLGTFDPAHPDPMTWSLPASPFRDIVKPDGN